MKRTVLLGCAALMCVGCDDPARSVSPARTAPAFAVSGAREAFEFTPLAFLGDPAPGGGTFVNDLEPYQLNALGASTFGADLDAGGEGIFLARSGVISEIARSGEPAPGGGTFGPFFLGTPGINDAGEVAFVFHLEPEDSPFENAGLYRFSPIPGVVTPVVIPGITPMPGGGVFAGVLAHAILNNGGDIVFTGSVPEGLGVAAFRAGGDGNISSIASPGDPAPGGTFDFARAPSINDGGDIAFQAHLDGEPLGEALSSSVYLKRAATGAIQSIAHQGEAAPGGGTFLYASGPVINNLGQVAFVGGLTSTTAGVFLFSAGAVVPIARPGDPMPGGGYLVKALRGSPVLHLSKAGDLSFFAALNTGDLGLYVSSRGVLRLVAGTGTVMPGVGTTEAVLPGGGINERGQVLFNAQVRDASGQERVVLVLATPSPAT